MDERKDRVGDEAGDFERRGRDLLSMDRSLRPGHHGVSGTTAAPRGLRRVERWFVGVAMAVVAFVLEKVVMRSVRQGSGKDPSPTTLTSKGGEVDLE